jgi:simple sugar transport system ATP-binding protein
MVVDTNIIDMKNISIEFPGVKALQNVNCSFEGGHIKALVGANGAGKSTMMKVLTGVNNTYTGEIYRNGEKVEIRSPKDAKKLGISIVYQEVDTALAPNLTVVENIMMDHLVYGMKNNPVINWRYLNNAAVEVMNRLNMSIKTNVLVSSLNLAEKQMVIIARAIMTNCKFLILDEPTAPLSTAETEQLFKVIRHLRDDGVGIIFISHRLNELFEICDSITVLRDGKLAGNMEIKSDTSTSEIVELMLGQNYNMSFDKSHRKIGEVILETNNLGDLENRVHNVNMYARSGEIIGISGLVGAGKTELCKTLFGAYGKQKGSLKIGGKEVRLSSPVAAVKAGMAFIPEERRKEGVLVYEPVFSNLSIATLNKYTSFLGIINSKKELEKAKDKINQINIKTPSAKQQVALLSGGNQQKVTIGKWLDSSAQIYIFDEPTKGIDVGAKAEIYRAIVELAKQGKCIIYASSEQSEILLLSDRTYVMYDGTIQKEFITSKTNEAELLFYSTGGNKDEDK